MKFNQTLHRVLMAVLAVILMSGLVLGAARPAAAAVENVTYAGITILAVQKGETVTIQAQGMMRNVSYNIMLNKIGTKGEDGTVMGTKSADNTGAFTATVNIPSALASASTVAVRIQAVNYPASYAYNWFYNSTTGKTPSGSNAGGGNTAGQPDGPAAQGSVTVSNIEEDTSVDAVLKNAPANTRLAVWIDWRNRSGAIYGKQIGWDTTNANGVIDDTYLLPTVARDRIELRIRFVGPNFTAYRWFINGGSEGDIGTVVPAGYTGHLPYLKIVSIAKGDSVTVEAYNFPKGDYKVLMARMGTQGKDGTLVDTITVKKTGTFSVILDIPSGLVNRDQIAVRFQDADNSGFYTFTWFNNK